MTGIDIAGKKMTVIGAARSGIAVAGLLQSKGATVFVSDSSSEEKLKTHIPNLKSLGVEYEIGKHSDRLYDADMVVLSPGVPSNIPAVQEAERRGLNVVSEIEVASWFCPAPIIAITGTNGKTTTTTLIGRMLHDAKLKHIVAGNIGTAFSAVVSELDESSVAVIEVSSFQLDHIQSFRPHISVILNITPDHLDRYDGSFEKYAKSKCRIFMNQTKDDYLLYNYDDQMVKLYVDKLGASRVTVLPFSIQHQLNNGAWKTGSSLMTSVEGKRDEIVATEDITIRGDHNLYNSMAATLAALISDVRPASVRATLRNFKGVEHRLEFVREVNGVKYVNDSKATNVDSVWYALQSFKEPLVLILGGRDKGNDYKKIIGLVKKHVKTIVAIGESADKVVSSFSGTLPVHTADSMQDAVRVASSLAANGDVVLLSPACASFDWFENYEHRGKVFKEMVNAL